MKTIWKQTAAALAAGICICNLTLPAVSAKTEDSSNNVYLCDEGDFLSDAEFQEAMDELQEAADESGMNVALWIGNTAIGAPRRRRPAVCDTHLLFRSEILCRPGRSH